jgi:hypothetical protein
MILVDHGRPRAVVFSARPAASVTNTLSDNHEP